MVCFNQYVAVRLSGDKITDRQRIWYNIPQAIVYSLMLLKMGEIVARNMSIKFGFIYKPLLLHLVGFLLYHHCHERLITLMHVSGRSFA